MTFCKIAPPTSGTGNATVRIISQKNTSTTSRSQSFTVVSGTGIRRTITVNQEGAKSLPLELEWVIQPLAKSYKKNEKSVSAAVSLKNVLNAQFGKPIPNLKGEIYYVNGEEISETYDITTWGFSFSSIIANVQTNADGGNTVTATIYLSLDNPQAYEAAIGDTAYSEDEYGPYSSFTIQVGVQGMDGNYVYVDWDITVYQEALNRGTSGEITLSPEAGSMGIEDSCTFNVTYANIIPETIHFVPGPEMENSGDTVYLDSWTPPSGSDPASGSFSFTIASDSEATTESYSFDVTGQDAEGNPYTASGSVDIV